MPPAIQYTMTEIGHTDGERSARNEQDAVRKHNFDVSTVA